MLVYVKYVYDRGIMSGLNDEVFGAASSLARAQFAVIIHRLENTPAAVNGKTFPDVPAGIWYYDAVSWASSDAVGIIKGYQATGKFGPNDFINREQMAVMMYRYATYLNRKSTTYSKNEIIEILENYYNTKYDSSDYVVFDSEFEKTDDGYFAILRYQGGNTANILVSGIEIDAYGKVIDDLGNEWSIYNPTERADFSRFVDSALVNDFAEEAMSWAVAKGIITGKYGGTHLAPLENANRAECATIIQRFMEKVM